MKKQIILLCFLFPGIIAYCQNSLPNGDFETWNSGTFSYPQYYPYTSNLTTYVRQGVFNVSKVGDPKYGSFAIRVETTALMGDTSFGYFVNIYPGSQPPVSWHGGMAYDLTPSGISGWYKYNVATADSGTVIVAFSKGGVNLKTYFFKIGGIQSTYTPFKFNFMPPLSQNPDSVEFGALSCKFGPGMKQPLGVPGSILIMDSVNFMGVASQPADMNGDFELWQSQTIKTPGQWFILSNGDQETGVSQTSDAFHGSYAIEMKTFIGNQNGQPAAQMAGISTGHYPRNCGGSCTQTGGYPYTLKKDTLIFYYKYAPMADDKALVLVNFKLSGSIINTLSWNLDAASVYTKIKLPFEIPLSPDSVIVSILSSNWSNSALTYVGSDLKIDSIYFKSQGVITGIDLLKNEDDGSITVYPNPSDGKFSISSTLADISSVEIYNATGSKIFSMRDLKQQVISNIDMPVLQQGVYYLKISNGVIFHTKKIVIR